MPSNHRPTEPFKETTKIKSPRGEEFDLIGPAAPVRFKKAPGILAEAGGDLLVIKEGALFACSALNGDISPELVTGQGMYAQDCALLWAASRRFCCPLPMILLTRWSWT